MIVLLVLIIGTTTGFEFKCPVHAEWRLRAHAYCVSAADYVCLFHLLDKKYQDVCLRPDQSSIGSKLVFQPHFNIAKCKAARYQPIVYSTKGNSGCILQKSKCDEEGQVVYSNGSSSNDTLCRCDYTKGYTFVKQPNQSCFCIQSQEDCSCFRSACEKLSPDYRCINDGEIITNTKCLEIHLPQILQSSRCDAKTGCIRMTVATTGAENKGVPDAHQVLYIIIFIITVYVAIIALKCYVFVPPTILSQETSKYDQGEKTTVLKWYVRSYLPLTSAVWCRLHPNNVFLVKKSCIASNSQGLRTIIYETSEELETATYKCMASNIIGAVESEPVQLNEKENYEHQLSSTPLSSTYMQTDIHEFFQKEECGKHYFARVIFIGKNGVGKTSLMRRLLWGTKDQSSSTHITDGIDIRKCNINIKDGNWSPCNSKIEYDLTNGDQMEVSTQSNQEITESCFQENANDSHDMLACCALLDFASQKDFYATHHVFLSQYAVFLLVTDSLEISCDDQLWIDIQDTAQYVRFWFDAIHCYRSTTHENRVDPPIIVVCTNEDKIKNPNKRVKRQNRLKKNVIKILKQHQKEHLRNIYFVSNTEDDDFVFEKIRKEISSHAMTMKDWGKDCPLKWLLFQQVIARMKANQVPIATTTKLLTIARQDSIGINTDEELKRCLQYFNDIGTVIYFDEENLTDHVILDPKWLIGAFRCLVSDKIECSIKKSNDWLTLRETGELTSELICLLFKKEPKLKFLENKKHLLEVMKRFDIILKLLDSSALYMPCMMDSCSFDKVKKKIINKNMKNQTVNITSWLCLEFEFLPPSFFNHILAWYTKNYPVSAIFEKGTRTNRKALYRQIGVFDLDHSRCQKLVVCGGPNVIALQVWDTRMAGQQFGDLATNLFEFLKIIAKRYSLKISYTKSFKCKNGDFNIDRRRMDELNSEEYRCFEHATNHVSADLVQPWGFMDALLLIKSQKMIVFYERQLMRQGRDSGLDEDILRKKTLSESSTEINKKER